MQRITLSIPEAAKVLGISKNSAYAAAMRGEIPTVKIGSRILVPRAALEEWLKVTIGNNLQGAHGK
jgi:excisionase family DNA binding protein